MDLSFGDDGARTDFGYFIVYGSREDVGSRGCRSGLLFDASCVATVRYAV